MTREYVARPADGKDHLETNCMLRAEGMCISGGSKKHTFDLAQDLANRYKTDIILKDRTAAYACRVFSPEESA